MSIEFYNKLGSTILEIQKALEENQYLALYYYNQTGECFFITELSYSEPNLIILTGKNSKGDDYRILAHAQSLQLVLKAEEKVDKTKSTRIEIKPPIGFRKPS